MSKAFVLTLSALWLLPITPALAQQVGINNGGCTFASVAAAVAAAAPGDEIWLEEGAVFIEGGITISKNIEMRTGNSICLNPGVNTPTRAEIDGTGTLGNITIATGQTVLMENINIRDHVAAEGGNLHVDGELTLIDVGVAEGIANVGGGIFIDSGGLVEMISDTDTTQVFGNNAVDGGGVFVKAGGVLQQKNGSIIWANTARSGGGAYVFGLYEMSDQAKVSLNSVTANGGGIYVAEGGLLDSPSNNPCTDCFFGGNAADGYGGAIFSSEAVDLLFTTFSSNAADQSGGGIFLGAFGRLALYDVTLEKNSAGGYGGGIYSWGDTVIDSSSIIGNEAGINGGGLSFWANTVNVSSTRVESNTSNVDGGGISIATRDDNSVSVALEGVLVNGNNADGNGGGLHIVGNANVVSKGSRYLKNIAGAEGGGIMIAADDIYTPVFEMDGPKDLEGCISSPVVQPAFNRYCSEVRFNTANLGGGLLMRAGEATVERTAFWENDATSNALAIGLVSDDAPDLTLRNVLVVRHNGPEQRVIDVDNFASLDAFSVTVTDNTGIPTHYAANASGIFARSIIWDNGGDFEVVTPNSINATCTMFEGVTGGITGPNQTVGIDPLLTNTGRGNYRLSSVSPAIDQCWVGPIADLDSDPRPAGPSMRFDRGAFEWQ